MNAKSISFGCHLSPPVEFDMCFLSRREINLKPTASTVHKSRHSHAVLGPSEIHVGKTTPQQRHAVMKVNSPDIFRPLSALSDPRNRDPSPFPQYSKDSIRHPENRRDPVLGIDIHNK